MRLFLAAVLDPAIRSKLAVEIGRLRQTPARVRWAGEDDLHLTLKFCGELPQFEPLEAAVRDEVKGVSAVDIEVVTLGSFPGRCGPKIVWAGVRGSVDALVSACERAAEKVGVARERRPFAAHVTLGRVESERQTAMLADFIREGAGLSFGRMALKEVTIFRSPGRAPYEALSRIPLRSSARFEASI